MMRWKDTYFQTTLQAICINLYLKKARSSSTQAHLSDPHSPCANSFSLRTWNKYNTVDDQKKKLLESCSVSAGASVTQFSMHNLITSSLCSKVHRIFSPHQAYILRARGMSYRVKSVGHTHHRRTNCALASDSVHQKLLPGLITMPYVLDVHISLVLRRSNIEASANLHHQLAEVHAQYLQARKLLRLLFLFRYPKGRCRWCRRREKGWQRFYSLVILQHPQSMLCVRVIR
mmetsp:Transcript_6756/g.20477  ORF Transcript_6756/g.20477 Transcript_6756/m.20477 type:complete len:231 (-) Transcript_6756:1259-1951(-)